jgi:hypothetical protein
MAFENTTRREVPTEIAPQLREDYGVYVPVLLDGQRIVTEQNGTIIKGNRLQKTTSQHDAHIAAGARGIPTKTVTRLGLTNDESRFLNGIVEAVKPIHNHTIDLEKHELEVHDYASLEAHYADVLRETLVNDPDSLESSGITVVRRQLMIVRALAKLSLRV